MIMNAHGQLKTDLNRLDMTVGYHAPCHLKTLGVTNEPVELMQLITGCGACGMQIRQGTMCESIHPMKLLARAYWKQTAISEAA